MSGQPDFSTRPQARRPPRWEVVSGVLGLLVLAATGVLAWRARDEARATEARLAEVRRELDQQQARLRALAAGAERNAHAARDGASPVRIVHGIATVLPSDARLERLTIDYAHGTLLELGVEARSAASWDRLLEGLEGSPDFAEVAPGPESRQAEVRTTIRARWSGKER